MTTTDAKGAAYLATLPGPTRTHNKRVHAAKPFGLEEAHTDYETKEVWALPAPSPVNAAFGQEGLREMLSKLFAAEVQSDDEDFDKAVFITTSTTETTRTFLDDDEVRIAIRAFVDGGGHVKIDGKSIEIVQISETADQPCAPGAVATLIKALGQV